ncbi:MAG: hypothetical protein HY767_03345, partial [Candidatus Omnitrophica bacterium]|nr:hypothetical protein [Candidatus Omnitrophota bacterium]
MKGDRPVLVWVGDPLGTEFTQTTDPKTGDLTVRYNDGRRSVYSQVAGFYEIQRSTNLLGEVENYCYYGSEMGSACQGVDLEAAKKQIQSAIDALPGTGVDTGKAEFKVPELKAGDPGLDFSVKADGSITCYAAGDTKEWQEIPSAQYMIGEFGHVTVYHLEGKGLKQTLELRANRTIATVSKYDADGRVSDSYRYNPDGTKLMGHSVYTYNSTDKESKDFRLLKLVETYGLSDLDARSSKDITATSGMLESRVHYLARHAAAKKDVKGDLSETMLGRFDYLGLGLVDYTESYRRPLEAGGHPVFLSSVEQQYSVFRLVRSVTHKNLSGTTACGEGFSGCAITGFDEFTYIPGTEDIDFTSRYWVTGNDIENKTLQSVFRTEQVDEYTSVTHDFGKDLREDSASGGDDTFSVQTSVQIGDDLYRNAARGEWGSEVIEYDDISDWSLIQLGEDGSKGASEKIFSQEGGFTDRQSHAFQYDVNGDGSVTRTKSFKFIRGVETTELSYSESEKRLGGEAGY